MRLSFLRCAPLLLIATLGVGCDDDDDDITTPDTPAPQVTPAPIPSAAPTPAPAPAPPDPDSGPTESFFGTIDTLDPGMLDLSGRVFVLDSKTVYLDHQTPITFAQLSVGQTALVKARQNKDGVWFAREVKLREP